MDPLPNTKDEMNEELIQKAEEVLKRHLDGRVFMESKTEEWIKEILEDFEEYFNQQYPTYNLFLFCDICAKDINFYSYYTNVCSVSTEGACHAIFKSHYLYACLYFFFFQNFKSNPCFSLVPKIISTGNDLLYQIFDERRYNNKMSEYLIRLNNDHAKCILRIDKSRKIFSLALAFKKPLKNFVYNYKTNCNYNMKEIIQTFFTKDTEILHLLFIFSNEENN